jgi:hypothetical protein
MRIPKIYNGTNRTFWFVNFEQQKEPLGALVTIFVPTEAQLRGDFSGTTRVIRDPLTNQPFPNNVIPADRLDPLALNFIRQYVPAAQDAQGTHIYQRPADNNPTQLLGRGDQVLTQNQQLSGRMFITRRTEPRGSGNLPQLQAGTFREETDLLGLTHTWTLAPNKINTARFRFNGQYNGSRLLAEDRVERS